MCRRTKLVASFPHRDRNVRQYYPSMMRRCLLPSPSSPRVASHARGDTGQVCNKGGNDPGPPCRDPLDVAPILIDLPALQRRRFGTCMWFNSHLSLFHTFGPTLNYRLFRMVPYKSQDLRMYQRPNFPKVDSIEPTFEFFLPL